MRLKTKEDWVRRGDRSVADHDREGTSATEHAKDVSGLAMSSGCFYGGGARYSQRIASHIWGTLVTRITCTASTLVRISTEDVQCI